jgi:hypothetical protein
MDSTVYFVLVKDGKSFKTVAHQLNTFVMSNPKFQLIENELLTINWNSLIQNISHLIAKSS